VAGARVAPGYPEILGSDPCRAFTGEGSPGRPEDHVIEISMDDRGFRMDNVLSEWPWRGLNHEKIRRTACGSVDRARRGMGDRAGFPDCDRRRASVGSVTPDQVYHDLSPRHRRHLFPGKVTIKIL
jgi:hypothetical protein